MSDIDLAELKKYAKEHSAFEIENDRYGEGYINLSVTQNGRQWTTVSFVDAEEVEKVANALLKFCSLTKRAPDGLVCTCGDNQKLVIRSMLVCENCEKPPAGNANR